MQNNHPVSVKGAGTLKEQGTQLANQGRLTEAASVFAKILSFNTGDTDALMALGAISGMQGNYHESEKYLGKAIRINPGLAAAHYNLGIAQKRQGKLEEASLSYGKAIACRPDIASYHNNLGNIYMEMQQLDKAVDCFNNALKLEPDSADCYYNLGKVLRARGLRQDAVNAFNDALKFRPGFAAALKELGRVHLSLGDVDKAEKCYRTVADTDPGDHGAVSGLAKVLASKHDYDHAFSILEPHIGEQLPSAAIATAFADIARHAARREKEAVKLLEQLLQDGIKLSSDDRAQAHFRLGHFSDQIKKYDTAFEHFRKGNELRSCRTGRTVCEIPVDLISDSFNRDFISTAPVSNHPTDLAVFIVGMPRSGTTLVEQIIASHPRAFGAGELDTLPSLLSSIPQRVGTESLLPEALKLLDQTLVMTLSEKYLAHLKSLSAGAERITDKLPANFINLGLVSLLFPGAHIIHCRRAPLDTCLSCYFQDFAGHHPYATDLEALGRYYRQYERLMKHWGDVLEINLLEIDYEDLVNHFEATCKKIIGFCGLEWHHSCLEFHKNTRVVATSSSNQVIKPLYSDAVGRWQHYEKHLGPLIEALDLN